MKSNFYLLLILALMLSASLLAQTPDNQAYAITSETKGAFEWTEVKLINLDNGEVLTNVYENSKGEYTVYNGRSEKEIIFAGADSSGINDKRPFSGLSAACAYDKKSNRLYYAPLFINQLRYIDLSAAKPNVYIFDDQPFSTATDLQVEANHITRMVIASDGNGYALNNEGTHLVKFTTGKSPDMTDLGELSDAPANGEVSVKDANTSWGGDLLSDANGSLYLITAHNYVFKINVQTRVATFITEVKKLPPGFTTNGAAVAKDGKIVLSSANSITSYYVLDPSNWETSPVPANDHVYNTSDLANNNFLFNSPKPVETVLPVTQPEMVSVYPNPVKADNFRINFVNKKSGDYRLDMVDLTGRQVADRFITVTSAGQVSEVKVNPGLARGIYMVRLLNENNNEVFLKKIILQ